MVLRLLRGGRRPRPATEGRQRLRVRSYPIPPPQAPDVPPEVLKSAYDASPARNLKDTFVLYRIIGNDLPPRHAIGQARDNLDFILTHEPDFDGCEKRWIVNRIVDAEEERRIIALLSDAGQEFLRIPFQPDAFFALPWSAKGLPRPDFVLSPHYRSAGNSNRGFVDLHLRRRKNRYMMNNNGARNAALEDGRGRAKWVLPFDGNCFFTEEGFAALRSAVEAEPWYPYFVVPMARVTDNAEVFDAGFRPDYAQEPQIAFRQDAVESFDPNATYGRRPKIELLWRLGVPGIWDDYRFFDWDIQRPTLSPDAGRTKIAGGVLRLNSGKPELEAGNTSATDRATARTAAIISMLDGQDARIIKARHSPGRLGFYDGDRIADIARVDPAMRDDLVTRALGVPSPSGAGDSQGPARPGWLGRQLRRAAGPASYRMGPEARVFHDVTILALAHAATGDAAHASRAAAHLRHWLDTRGDGEPVEPNRTRALFASVGRSPAQPGFCPNPGLPFFLDALRLLAGSASLSSHEQGSLDTWLRDLHATSLARRAAPSGPWDHPAAATWAEAERAATASYLGDFDTLAQLRNAVPLRLESHFSMTGEPIGAMASEQPRRTCASALEAWAVLLKILARYDIEGRWPDTESRLRLRRGHEWLAVRAATASASDASALTLSPLWAFYHDLFPDAGAGPVPIATGPSVPDRTDGTIAPFWTLSGLRWFDDHAR